MTTNASARTYRTLFISDVHLGTKACQADKLLEFLDYANAETIYLVGDIVDFWRLRRSTYWPQSHNDVIQTLLGKARGGARIVLIPGNHDEVLRGFAGKSFGGIEICLDDVHETADGRKFLILHGDEFDIVTRYAKWLAFLGDWAYEAALWSNTHLNAVRRRVGLGYWSLSAYLKLKVKQAVNYVDDFESALIAEAGERGVDGILCGHIHHAAMRDVGAVTYVNTGDWVESCTAVAENLSGRLEIIDWRRITEAGENRPAGRAVVAELDVAA